MAAGLAVEPHFITEADADGKVITNAGHSVGNRTLIVHHFGDPYFIPDSPAACRRTAKNDFDLRDEQVRYATANGVWVISYTQGYPIGRFEHKD